MYASSIECNGVCSGLVFPPYFVLERGMTLREWIVHTRDFFAITSMLMAVASLLSELHEGEHCHLDIKVGLHCVHEAMLATWLGTILH
jgi:hypothetical protein